MTASHFRCSVSAESSSALATILQPLVIDLTDLALQTKHAHWNVRGALFASVHVQLDSINAMLREAADQLAERQVMLGHPVDGSSQSIAKGSRLNPIRVNFLSVLEVIEDISNRLHSVIGSLRQGIEESGSLDVVTQDMLIGITAELEKNLWMLQAQQL